MMELRTSCVFPAPTLTRTSAVASNGDARGKGLIIRVLLLAVAAVCAAAGRVCAQEVPPSPSTNLSPTDLFGLADQARDSGDFGFAETAYRALASNPDSELRTEARFRLAMMLADKQQNYAGAAIELRKILDEKPKAARVRLELARMQAMLGRFSDAERELRAAQAGGLPPEVERLVRFYTSALSGRKPFGGSIEIAVAPDSNINRATKSDTLGTVIGDFTLDQNAKAQSGVGLALRGQTYVRTPLDKRATLLVRLSGSADIYSQSQFDDMAAGIQIGPEYVSGHDKIAVSVGPAWRWYGLSPYSFSVSGSANWQHPMGKRTQLRVDGGIAHVNNLRNNLQDADNFSLTVAVDRAFTQSFGGGLQISANREAARDPGYATASGGINQYLFREFGKTTAVLSFGYNHLEADKRLFLYPKRRVDDRYSVSLAGTFRALRVGPFAPLARLRFERNISTIELYDFKRFGGEIGIVSAF